MATEQILILLEIEPDGESLTGRAMRIEPCEPDSARVSGSGAHGFSGWLGLLSALETLVPCPPPPDRPAR